MTQLRDDGVRAEPGGRLTDQIDGAGNEGRSVVEWHVAGFTIV